MTGSSLKARLALAAVISAAASGALAQAAPPLTDAQIQAAAQQVANGTPHGGYIPSPSDIAHGMANMAYGSQTQIVNNPNANPNGTTVTQATQTSFGQTAVGIGSPLVGHSQQVGDIIDEMQGAPGSQQYQNQQAQIRANQHDGPGYYTTDLATGVSTWHPMPPNADYSAMDAYMQQRQANQQQIRDPFAQPPDPATPTAPPPPTVQPQQPGGPNYPTYQPSGKATPKSNPLTADDIEQISAALAAAAGAVAAQEKAEAQQSGDAGAVAAEAAGAAAAGAIEAAILAQATAIASQAYDDGCSTGACGSYLAHPYDTSKWQPMPMFTEGQGSITDNGASMTQVAQLLQIYNGYDPFAHGNLVPWPGQMMFPSLYQPTGVSSGGLVFDPSLGASSGYQQMLAQMWTGPSSVMTTPDLQAVLCGR
jgi:hypothetical protein